MFSTITIRGKSAVLSMVGACVVAAAAPRADGAFTYYSSHRSTISHIGPDLGPWYQPSFGSNSYQLSDLSPTHFFGFGGGAIDIANPGTDAFAGSTMEAVFATDTTENFTLQAGGQFVNDGIVSVSLWRVDRVTRSETLLARAVPSDPFHAGTIEPGNRYHLLASGYMHIHDAGNLSFRWSAEMPAPGGVALIAPLGVFALRRQR